MAVCPDGHDSASEDFCDVCGMRILSPGAASSPPAGTAPGAPVGPAGGIPQAAGPGPSCPVCGTARSGQFCESCGFNFAAVQAPFASPPAPPVPPMGPVPTERSVPVTPPPPPAPPYAPVVWTVVVSCDRDYYDSVRAESGPEGESIPFPAYCAERRFRLSGSQLRIGRRSVSRGLDPEIDLTGPPADPGISRLHAVLIAGPDGSWSVLDPGSANGTLVNGTEIPTGDPVRLRDGDRINLGAWTAITVRCG